MLSATPSNDISGLMQGSIEGRRDIAGGRLSTDRRAAGNLSSGASFTSLAFSADGSFLLAGGASNFVCLYDASERVLLARFQVSLAQSLLLCFGVQQRHARAMELSSCSAERIGLWPLALHFWLSTGKLCVLKAELEGMLHQPISQGTHRYASAEGLGCCRFPRIKRLKASWTCSTAVT